MRVPAATAMQAVVAAPRVRGAWAAVGAGEQVGAAETAAVWLVSW